MPNQLISLLTNSKNACILQDLKLVKQMQPIVHSIMNMVTMPICANVLLSVGASPIMAHSPEELNDIANFAKSLVINIGTLDEFWLNAIKLAQKIALTKNIPIIFDPVGAGATTYRTIVAHQILATGVTILRGNAAEIMALQGAKITTAGIDSMYTSDHAQAAARDLAQKYNCVVVVSGARDYIATIVNECFIDQGSPFFSKVTGMGCAVTTLIGAFAAINLDYFLAAKHAMSLFTLAGAVAAKYAKGCGSFYTELLDNLYNCQQYAITAQQFQLSSSP